MGCSFSSVLTAVEDGNTLMLSKAMVVAADGSLLMYSGGIRASEVIIVVGQAYALCNSDKLSFDAYPPTMASNEVLVSGQIYFLLPVAELNQRLSAANVATLAIRASAAMNRVAEKQGRRSIWVAPVAMDFDVEVQNKVVNFDSRLVMKATEMGEKKRKKKGMVGFGSKHQKRVLATIDEVDEV